MHKIPRAKTSGTITVRSLTSPDTISTTAEIKRGELTEAVSAVARRLGIITPPSPSSSSPPPLGEAPAEPEECSEAALVDAHGILIMGKLRADGEYFIPGALRSNNSDEGGGEGHGSRRSPDATVYWAYDARMLLHDPGTHRAPETPYRLERAMASLLACPRAAQLLPAELLLLASSTSDQGSDGGASVAPTSENRARFIPPRLASLEEVTAVHDVNVYRDFIEEGAALGGLPSDVYCNEGTSSVAARLAAGAAIDACKCVLAATRHKRARQEQPQEQGEGVGEEEGVALCLVRPPGHHCGASGPSGFCLLNNVAIAAAAVLADASLSAAGAAPRIAIIDLDVHFGEGTASYVESRAGAEADSLLYCSIHRYDDGSFYPFDARGSAAYTGNNNNNNNNKNHENPHCIFNMAVDTGAHLPAQCHEVISDELLTGLVERALLPRLEKWAPDLLLVSLGFDAAYGDPRGKMAVEGGFAHCLRLLRRWCRGRQGGVGLVCVLEGGYSPEAVSRGVLAAAHALSLPFDDADVEAMAQPRAPKTWRDLRSRLERRGDAEELGKMPASEEELSRRHTVWCEEVIRQYAPTAV